MKEKHKEIEINNSTFKNINITNKKSEIISKVNLMNITENNNIKIFNISFLPSYLKKNELLMKNEYEKNYLKNNIHFPLKKISNTRLNKIQINSTPSFSNIKNKDLISLRKKKYKKKNINISFNKNFIKDKYRPYKLIYKNENKNKNLTEEICDNNKDNINSKNINSSSRGFKSIINLDEKNKIKINNLSNKIKKIKNMEKLNNITTPYNKYYITTQNFVPKIEANKIKNLYIHKNSNKQLNNIKILDAIKSFNLNNINDSILQKINNNIKIEDNSVEENNLNKLNKIPRINLNYWKLIEIENKFYEIYNNNCNDVTEKSSVLKKIKDKCRILLEEIDKKNNFEIQQIIKEIKEQLFGLGFKDFFNYLLTILKNYDKKIIDYSYEIIDEKKECPEELKYKNVRYRHKKFMGLLDRQYVCGLNVSNRMNYLIKNSKNKLGFDNKDYYNSYTNKTYNSQEKFIDNFFNENKYKSKFFETFLRNKDK